jgi:hypothetical protein
VNAPRTLRAVFEAAVSLELHPSWAIGGTEVVFDCPHCFADNVSQRASARRFHARLLVECNGCSDDQEPGILAVLAGAAPAALDLIEWWEPPIDASGQVAWPEVARRFMQLLHGVRSQLADTATLASEFELGVVMGREQRERWDAIVDTMRELERRVLYVDDALLTAAALDQVRSGAAS